jgi:magnesium chelatase family protein
VSRVVSAALAGVDGAPVEVEVRISSQLPRVDVVGLPAAAVRESAARVRSAIQAMGQPFPDRRVTVSLAPAELRKTGAALDLPIAIAILAETGAFESTALEGMAFVGELALDGRLRPVRGALALALAVRDAGCAQLVVPASNGAEAGLAPGLVTLVAAELEDVVRHLLDAGSLAEAAPPPGEAETESLPDLAEVRGQESAKRALEIAAAGGHALLLRGAPGSGKTMLARRLPGLLAPLSPEEGIEVAKIHGAAGRERALLSRARPFRAPHHSASAAGLLGGGNPPRPGEASLAHHGVLFLDELAEFRRHSLESLRQILEDGRVAIARAQHQSVFPTRFQLVAATNPCPCGWRGSGLRDCRCDDGAVARYTGRISGPLLDRIDLCCDVRPVPWKDLDAPSQGETSQTVRARCDVARTRQRERGVTNGFLRDADLDRVVAATPEARQLLGRAVDRFGLSARSARKTLKVARTIADLAGDARVGPAAIAEAIGTRPETS